MTVQTKSRAHANGFVAEEFQEWLRLRVLIRIRQLARQHFRERDHEHWFSWKLYRELCDAVGHDHTGWDPMFLLSLDGDPRHCMKDYGGYSNISAFEAGRYVDRRLIEHGKAGYIPIDPLKNYVPTAHKVPDSLQLPIESFFGPVKRKFKKLQHRRKENSPHLMIEDIREAIKDAATPEHIRKCFEHGELCMRVLTGKVDEVVHHKGVAYHCTYGKWLPRALRA